MKKRLTSTFYIPNPKARPSPSSDVTYHGCSLLHRCDPCSPTRRHSASAEGCSAPGSDTETHPLCTPSHSQSVRAETPQVISHEKRTRKREKCCFNMIISDLCITLSYTDLIGAIQTVVVSVTPQAGWHTAPAGAHVLIHRARGDGWKRRKDICHNPFTNQEIIIMHDLFHFSFCKEERAPDHHDSEGKRDFWINANWKFSSRTFLKIFYTSGLCFLIDQTICFRKNVPIDNRVPNVIFIVKIHKKRDIYTIIRVDTEIFLFPPSKKDFQRLPHNIFQSKFPSSDSFEGKVFIVWIEVELQSWRLTSVMYPGLTPGFYLFL